jgi:MFS superfamily sulfate permease-like transporter
LFGRAAVGLLKLIPAAVLGVLLAYVGIQHAAYLRDILRRPLLLIIAACVGVVSLLTTNLMWGFLAGFLLQAVLLTIQKTRENREGA